VTARSGWSRVRRPRMDYTEQNTQHTILLQTNNQHQHAMENTTSHGKNINKLQKLTVSHSVVDVTQHRRHTDADDKHRTRGSVTMKCNTIKTNACRHRASLTTRVT
jgi:hypothetical protein